MLLLAISLSPTEDAIDDIREHNATIFIRKYHSTHMHDLGKSPAKIIFKHAVRRQYSLIGNKA